jgi:hypothetical protein
MISKKQKILMFHIGGPGSSIKVLQFLSGGPPMCILECVLTVCMLLIIFLGVAIALWWPVYDDLLCRIKTFTHSELSLPCGYNEKYV